MRVFDTGYLSESFKTIFTLKPLMNYYISSFFRYVFSDFFPESKHSPCAAIL